MARSINSDYIDFSHMGGFDMGIDFNGFEDNVKKFMELPIKYLDSAHDKAVEFIEDVHAIFYGPFTDDEVPNNDDCYVITESSPTSIEKELVGPNTEPSTPASFITMENSSTGCDTDAHQTESFSTKSTGLSLMNHVYPENNSSEGAHIESNDLCILPEDISTTIIYDSSEEVILWNPVTSVKPQRSHELTTVPQDDHAPHALETEVTEQFGLNCSGRHSDSSVCSGVIPLENSCANYEEQMVLHSANDPVGVTVHDSTTITQDDYVPHTLHMEQMTEQAGLHWSGHSDILVNCTDFFNAPLLEDSSTNYERTVCMQPCQATLPGTQANRPEVHIVSYSANSAVESTTHGTCISHDSSTSVSSCVDDPSMSTDNMVNSVDIDLRDGQKHMKNDKIEVYPVPQRENASFKKMFLRNLSRKLRWSKKQADTNQAMTSGSQDAENLGYQLVSSSDDLEDGWEVL